MTVPDFLPVLAKGKHKTPAQGACLMELAGFLAGEPWSDSPACTHPVLAAMARAVWSASASTALPNVRSGHAPTRRSPGSPPNSPKPTPSSSST